MNLEYKLPLSTDLLLNWIPHRPPMVWVDEVIEIGNDNGICKVILSPSKAYFSEGKIRASSCIEWMAQSYGFCEVARKVILDDSKNTKTLKKAFLVGISNFKLTQQELKSNGEYLMVHVKTIRELNPLILFKGTIYNATGESIASAQLKIYAES